MEKGVFNYYTPGRDLPIPQISPKCEFYHTLLTNAVKTQYPFILSKMSHFSAFSPIFSSNY